MKKNKEHKKGESTIGKIIYGFLLFMPLFAIGVTCGYAMFNKNAYQSYADEKENQYIKLSEVTEYPLYDVNFNLSNGINYTSSTRFQVSDVKYNFGNLTQTLIDSLESTSYLQIWRDVNLNTNYCTWQNANTNISALSNSLNITFTLNQQPPIGNSTDYDMYFYSSITNNKLDNVFYYAVDKVTENPLFSWSQNSIIYTTLNNTCNTLSITTPFIPLILAYWLIISIIYFLYDIALMLIWLLHDKIHEMRDSLA